MQVLKFPFGDVPQFAERDRAYTLGHPALRSFYKYDVHIQAFDQVFKDKSHNPTNRSVLVQVLKNQYNQLAESPLVMAQIEKLAHPNTFTVVTAHQPSLFTGPLYFIYKIISAINLAESLNQHYPAYHTVPVFVIGSEDHDFDEVNHLNLFGKRIEWQSNEQGAVGMMKTQAIKPLLEELKPILGESTHAQQLFDLLQKAYNGFENYGEATQYFINELFKQYGLVVFNMNESSLKRIFIPFIKKEIFEKPSHALVVNTQQSLSEVGFSPQATAREINFFYMKEQLRARIVFEEEQYKVLGTNLVFTSQEMLQEIENHPERFSPNVVMRPIYQEVILPNLAYIGGGGELAYWQERLTQFSFFGVNFPMLVRRNSAMLLDSSSMKRLEKLGLQIKDLFEDTENLIKRFLKENSSSELSLNHEKIKVQLIFDDIVSRANDVDPTLKKTVLAEQAKALNSIGILEGKLLKAEKSRQETSVNQIRTLREKFFPNKGLQERFDNFMSFYTKYGPDFFDILKQELHPLQTDFIVFCEQ
jgi:bacillithiol biosynthesis cysteine-adding enzyme BshC